MITLPIKIQNKKKLVSWWNKQSNNWKRKTNKDLQYKIKKIKPISNNKYEQMPTTKQLKQQQLKKKSDSNKSSVKHTQ